MSEDLPNVLAGRYAGNEKPLVAKWKDRDGREFWIAVMRAQRELGVKIEKVRLPIRRKLS